VTEGVIASADEGRHEPGPEELWGESWYFDFFDDAGTVGGWIRLGLYPNLRVAWYHAFVVGPSRRIVALSDLEVPLPTAPGLEIRTHGLWADHTCETALEHWTVGNEAFGLAVDDPSELYAEVPVGDRVPLGFDLEWETEGSPYHYVATTRYEIPCRVHGEVLVGDEQLAIDGYGQRDHSWGVRDWWQFGWCWTSGRLDDGTRFHGSDIRIPGVDVGFGYVQGGTDVAMATTNAVNAEEDTDADGFPESGSVTIGDLPLDIEPVAFGPALLTWENKVSRFPRAMCRFTSADGRNGLGWTEWNQPRLGDG
jgi:hypothetical protein